MIWDWLVRPISHLSGGDICTRNTDEMTVGKGKRKVVGENLITLQFDASQIPH